MSTVKPGGKIAIILLAVGGIGFGVFKLRETLPKQVETTTETVTTPESSQPAKDMLKEIQRLDASKSQEEIVKTVDLSNVTEAPQVKKKETSVKKDKSKKKSNSSKPTAEDSHSEAPSNSNNVIPNF
jgi:hypothetical protein